MSCFYVRERWSLRFVSSQTQDGAVRRAGFSYQSKQLLASILLCGVLLHVLGTCARGFLRVLWFPPKKKKNIPVSVLSVELSLGVGITFSCIPNTISAQDSPD